MENKIVKVTWMDALRLELGVLEDQDLLELEPLPCDIIGFLVHENKERIVLAQEKWHENKGQKYIHVIPKQSIISITELTDLHTRTFKWSEDKQ